jgi:hypothetical protein
MKTLLAVTAVLFLTQAADAHLGCCVIQKQALRTPGPAKHGLPPAPRKVLTSHR